MKYEEYMDMLQDKVVAALEKGVNPWQGPWEIAKNGVSNRPYSGANAIFLSLQSSEFFNGDARYFTFDQAKSMGCKVKAGEKATPAFFFKSSFTRDMKDEDGKLILDENGNPKKETVSIPPVFKVYYLFNAQQLNPIPKDKEVPADIERFDTERADQYVQSSPACIEYGRPSSAFYSPSSDKIVTFPKSHFGKNPQEYYSTVFHEMAHSTGAEHRLDRPMNGKSNPESYAKEELIAEISALHMCTKCGMKYTNENSAAYIDFWKNMLSDKDFSLASLYKDVSSACDYLSHPEARSRLHQSATYGDKKHPTEPVVQILESSSNRLSKGNDMNLLDAELVFSEINSKAQGEAIACEGSDAPTPGIKYALHYIGNGKLMSYTDSFMPGQEKKGLLGSIEEHSLDKAKGQAVSEKEQNEGVYNADKLLPYLKNHLELSALKIKAFSELKNCKDEKDADKKNYCEYLIRYANNGKRSLNTNISCSLSGPKSMEEYKAYKAEKAKDEDKKIAKTVMAR